MTRWGIYNRMHRASLAAVICSVCIMGCGGGGDSGGEQSGEPAAVEVKRVEAGKLPPLATTPPMPLDLGRIELRVPEKWNAHPGSLDLLARFKPEGSNAPIPVISMKAEDVSGDVPTVTVDNAADFKAWMQKRLTTKDASFPKKLIEPVRPMVIGDRPGVRYVMNAKLGDIVIERQVLHTLIESRLYTVYLDVAKDKLTADVRDASYALFAGFKVVDPNAPKKPDEEAPAKTDPAEPEKKPDAAPAKEPAAKEPAAK